MSQTVAIEVSQLNKIFKTLLDLKQEVARLAKKIDGEPAYGSDEWWEKSDEKALKSIKQGKGITLHSSKEIDDFFKSL